MSILTTLVKIFARQNFNLFYFKSYSYETTFVSIPKIFKKFRISNKNVVFDEVLPKYNLTII